MFTPSKTTPKFGEIRWGILRPMPSSPATFTSMSVSIRISSSAMTAIIKSAANAKQSPSPQNDLKNTIRFMLIFKSVRLKVWICRLLLQSKAASQPAIFIFLIPSALLLQKTGKRLSQLFSVKIPFCAICSR